MRGNKIDPNQKSAPLNPICPNKLPGNQGGCMGYMDIKNTNSREFLKCPLCGYTIEITNWKKVTK